MYNIKNLKYYFKNIKLYYDFLNLILKKNIIRVLLISLCPCCNAIIKYNIHVKK